MSLTSCAFLEERIQFPDHEMTTTGVSAATGALIGAGIGTLVGSSTSHAGEGFVLGSLAGAAAGGAIGRGFEDLQSQIDNQEEEIVRQEESIRNQKKTLQELRRRLDDQLSEKNSPSSLSYKSSSNSKYDVNRYTGHPDAKDYGKREAPQPTFGSAVTPQRFNSVNKSVSANSNHFLPPIDRELNSFNKSTLDLKEDELSYSERGRLKSTIQRVKREVSIEREKATELLAKKVEERESRSFSMNCQKKIFHFQLLKVQLVRKTSLSKRVSLL